ncbi:MAG: hypothetical protein ACU84J_04695, partial [Gammaproteobacteria bacterium]
MPTELVIRFTDTNAFTVAFDEQQSGPLTFQSPLEDADFEDLSWYLETYAAGYITDVDDARASNID